MAFAVTLHLLAAVIWVGGMFFAYMVLRPVAAAQLEPPLRLTLWQQSFKRFFVWVWLCIIVLPATGYGIIFFVYDGFKNIGIYIHVMHLLGLVMIAIYLYLYYRPYQCLKRELKSNNFPVAAKHLNSIRLLVATNLTLGMITIIVASLGRYYLA